MGSRFPPAAAPPCLLPRPYIISIFYSLFPPCLALSSRPFHPQIARDIAEGLAYLHPAVVHRDLKPQNVLLGADGRALVADFGISRVKDPARSYLSHATAEHGTPMYMAPELLNGSRVDEKVRRASKCGIQNFCFHYIYYNSSNPILAPFLTHPPTHLPPTHPPHPSTGRHLRARRHPERGLDAAAALGGPPPLPGHRARRGGGQPAAGGGGDARGPAAARHALLAPGPARAALGARGDAPRGGPRGRERGAVGLDGARWWWPPVLVLLHFSTDTER